MCITISQCYIDGDSFFLLSSSHSCIYDQKCKCSSFICFIEMTTRSQPVATLPYYSFSRLSLKTELLRLNSPGSKIYIYIYTVLQPQQVSWMFQRLFCTSVEFYSSMVEFSAPYYYTIYILPCCGSEKQSLTLRKEGYR